MHRKIVVYQNDNNTNLINVFVYEDNKLVEVYEENAEDKLFGKLGEVKRLREKNGAVIAICGCMMQEKHIIDKI